MKKPLTVHNLAAFLWRRLPGWRTWTREEVRSWVAWHAHHDWCGAVRDEEGKILAGALARPVDGTEEGCGHYQAQPGSRIILVEALAAVHTDAFRACVDLLHRRFPDVQECMFRRFGKGPRLRRYRFSTLNQHMKGVPHGR